MFSHSSYYYIDIIKSSSDKLNYYEMMIFEDKCANLFVCPWILRGGRHYHLSILSCRTLGNDFEKIRVSDVHFFLIWVMLCEKA